MIAPILDMPVAAMFGKSAIALKNIGEGKEHKEARQVKSKLTGILSLLGINHCVGSDYLEHAANHTPYIDVRIGDSYFFIGTKSVSDLPADSAVQIPDLVKLIGGTCIGGSETIKGIDAVGSVHSLLESDVPDTLNSPVEQLIFNPKPTIYEIDTIERTSSLINSMVENGMKEGKQVSMYWHVPLPEYILYMKQYFDSGVLNQNQCSELIASLEKKAGILKAWLTRRLKPKLMEIEFGSPLESILLGNNIFDDQFTLENVLSQLCCDPLWKSIIANSSITTWTQLADASYSYMYLQQSSHKGITIGIENPEEGKILSVAKGYAKQSGTPFNMTCLYPHPSFLETGTIPARLYRHKMTIPSEVKLIHNSY